MFWIRQPLFRRTVFKDTDRFCSLLCLFWMIEHKVGHEVRSCRDLGSADYSLVCSACLMEHKDYVRFVHADIWAPQIIASCAQPV